MDCKHYNRSYYETGKGVAVEVCHDCKDMFSVIRSPELISATAQADRVEALAREIFARYVAEPDNYRYSLEDSTAFAFAAARAFYDVADQERGKP